VDGVLGRLPLLLFHGIDLKHTCAPRQWQEAEARHQTQTQVRCHRGGGCACSAGRRVQ
jgi:hypothetical protein